MMVDMTGKVAVTVWIKQDKETAANEIQDISNLIEAGKDIEVNISQVRKKRSNDANSLLWVLSQKIAERLHTTKELVYRKYIREVGQFEIVPIKNEAVDRWCECWNEKGIGWFAEVLSDSKLPGYKKVISYYGSSIYDSREMSVLLNEIVSDCKSMGIPVISDDEINSLIKEWGINQ
jgi:hypothetical protein